jgi:hypothetical protein
MTRHLLRGAVAGAIGTLVLNALTYLDVLVRGRAPSQVPDRVAARMAGAAGTDLRRPGEGPAAAAHRRTGLGALLGYATGLGVGAVFGLLRPRLRRVPWPVAGVGAGLAAMAATDVPVVASGVSHPRNWGVSGWLADLVPHVGFGLATAAALDRLAAGNGRH